MRLSGPVSTCCACNKKSGAAATTACVHVMYLSLKFQGKLSWERRAKDYTCLIHMWPASMSRSMVLRSID